MESSALLYRRRHCCAFSFPLSLTAICYKWRKGGTTNLGRGNYCPCFAGHPPRLRACLQRVAFFEIQTATCLQHMLKFGLSRWVDGWMDGWMDRTCFRQVLLE